MILSGSWSACLGLIETGLMRLRSLPSLKTELSCLVSIAKAVVGEGVPD